jgi:transposase
MAIEDGHGLPIAICTHEAGCHEVNLVEKTLSASFIRPKPKRIIGDKAYDSDQLDKKLKKKKTKLIAPHRKNRKSNPTQDGRELRRYSRRWKIERLFAWIFNFRKCHTRYEYYEENFLGFVQLACIIILTRNYF